MVYCKKVDVKILHICRYLFDIFRRFDFPQIVVNILLSVGCCAAVCV